MATPINGSIANQESPRYLSSVLIGDTIKSPSSVWADYPKPVGSESATLESLVSDIANTVPANVETVMPKLYDILKHSMNNPDFAESTDSFDMMNSGANITRYGNTFMIGRNEINVTTDANGKEMLEVTTPQGVKVTVDPHQEFNDRVPPQLIMGDEESSTLVLRNAEVLGTDGTDVLTIIGSENVDVKTGGGQDDVMVGFSKGIDLSGENVLVSLGGIVDSNIDAGEGRIFDETWQISGNLFGAENSTIRATKVEIKQGRNNQVEITPIESDEEKPQLINPTYIKEVDEEEKPRDPIVASN